jgi:phosphatidylglycerophosphatase A
VKRLIRFVATLGPIGFAPVAPATVASAVVTLIGWFLPVPALAVALLLIALGTLGAFWICGEVEKDLGHDAHPIVADEVIGQSLALLFAPHTAIAFLGAFVLFRIFDVWKPLGAHQAQSLPGGIGVVADDMIAGLAACGTLHLALWGARAAGVSL